MNQDQSVRIDAGMLIAFDGESHRLIVDGSLVFSHGEITYAGPRISESSGHAIDMTDHVVAPGFVSLHGHLTDSPLTKSVLEDRGNKVFGMSGLYEFLTPIGKATTRRMALAAGRSSILEIVRSGVTTMVDLCTPYPNEMAELAGSAGVRAYIGPTVRSATWRVDDDSSVGYDWLTESEEAKGLAAAVEFMDAFEGSYGGRINSMMAPAQVDTTRPELFRETIQIARERGIPIQTHASQSAIEFREMVRRTGLTPIGFLDDIGFLGPNATVGHGVFIEGHSSLAYPGHSDRRLLAESHANVAHCPWVFGRRGQVMESFDSYVRAGINVGLGMDTFPQSMLFEMRMASVLSKVVDRDTQTATALDAFNAATLGSARALGRDDLGRLSPGARADFVCYRTNTLNMAPLRDPLRSIVYSAQPSDIEFVYIDGKEVMRDGEMAGFDEATLAHDLQEAAEDLWASLPIDGGGKRIEEISPQSLSVWNRSMENQSSGMGK